MAGQPPERFGSATLHELLVIMGAAARRDARLAWLGAVYVLRAFHTPDDMPDDPGLPSRTDVAGPDADTAYIHAFFTALSERT